MNTRAAYNHAQGHYRQEIKTSVRTSLERMTQYANGRMIYICVSGWEMDTVNAHGTPFFVGESELNESQGVVTCEYCENECIRLDN